MPGLEPLQGKGLGLPSSGDPLSSLVFKGRHRVVNLQREIRQNAFEGKAHLESRTAADSEAGWW